MSGEDPIVPSTQPTQAAVAPPSPAPVQTVQPAGSVWAFASLKSVQLVAVGLIGVMFGAVLATGVALALSHGHRGHGQFGGPGRIELRDHPRFEDEKVRPWQKIPGDGDGLRREPRN